MFDNDAVKKDFQNEVLTTLGWLGMVPGILLSGTLFAYCLYQHFSLFFDFSTGEADGSRGIFVFFLSFLLIVLSGMVLAALGHSKEFAAEAKNTPHSRWSKFFLVFSGFFWTLYGLGMKVLSSISCEGGIPYHIEQKYTLQNHGHLIRELSKNEFLQLKWYHDLYETSFDIGASWMPLFLLLLALRTALICHRKKTKKSLPTP